MSVSSERIRFCTSADGTRIAFAVCGEGPPLVWVQHWVHHLNLDWNHPVWQPLLRFLSIRHTVIRYDWRGCGLSDRDGVTFASDRYAEDLDAVIKAAGINGYTLFGMAGAGSAATIWHAATYPEQVTRLIVCGSHAHGRMARNPTPEQIAETRTRLKVYELGWPNENPAYAQFFTALHIPDATQAQMRAYDDLVRQTATPANAASLLKSFWELELGPSLPRVQCPTLVLHARGDCIIPFERLREVASLIPRARFVPLESRNHVLFEGEAAWPVMVQAVEDFLPPVEPADAPNLEVGDLTTREREILDALAQGLSNNEIATRLAISAKTVRNHVSNVFGKLGVTSRSQAIVRARQAGFGLAAPRLG